MESRHLGPNGDGIPQPMVEAEQGSGQGPVPPTLARPFGPFRLRSPFFGIIPGLMSGCPRQLFVHRSGPKSPIINLLVEDIYPINILTAKKEKALITH